MSEDAGILRRDFRHRGTPYSFRWNIEHHRTIGRDTGDSAALWGHLQAVLRGSVPEEPFNSPFFRRASSLRLRKMTPHKRIGLYRRFLRSGMITESIDDSLVRLLRQYQQRRGLNTHNTDHSILEEFVQRDPQTVAMEVPVWSESLALSGHIDLVRIIDGAVQVCDYKPGPLEQTKRRFLQSLPQVAAYGEMMAHHLASTLRTALEAPLLPKIRCAIFDSHTSWHFGAEMYMHLVAASLIPGLE